MLEDDSTVKKSRPSDLDHIEIDNALIRPVSISEVDGAAGAEHTCLFRTRLDTGQQGDAQIKMQ